MKQHNAIRLQNNTNLQEEIITSLEYMSFLNAGIDDDEILIKIRHIWAYNGSVDDDCQLQQSDFQVDGSALSHVLFGSWISFYIEFINVNKQDNWKNNLGSIIDAFNNELSKLEFFINDTISISYCQDILDDTTNKSDHNLEILALICTICLAGTFGAIGICGCVDATFIRRNEIFSISAVCQQQHTLLILFQVCNHKYSLFLGTFFVCFQFCVFASLRRWVFV